MGTCFAIEKKNRCHPFAKILTFVVWLYVACQVCESANLIHHDKLEPYRIWTMNLKLWRCSMIAIQLSTIIIIALIALIIGIIVGVTMSRPVSRF
jgi:ABC-type proline/glycine betaine transport system permease subunit